MSTDPALGRQRTVLRLALNGWQRGLLRALGVLAVLTLAVWPLRLLSPVPSALTALTRAEVATSPGAAPPQTGWSAYVVPKAAAGARPLPGRMAPRKWVRFRFDPAALPPGRLALASHEQTQGVVAFLNGHEVYQTDAESADRRFSWHRPHFMPLPPELLRGGVNDVVFRADLTTDRSLDIGTVLIGPQPGVRAEYNRLYYFEVIGPQIVNGVLLIATVAALLCWWARPRETIFGWLVLVGSIWWFRNLQSYVSALPLDVDLFWALTTDCAFMLMVATYGFAATLLRLRHRRVLIAIVALDCVVAMLSRYVFDALQLDDTPSFLMTLPVVVMTLYVLAQACWREPRLENLMMLAAVGAGTLFAFLDLALTKHDWAGAGFPLLPYGGLLVFSAFGLALGRRVLDALVAVERVNATLHQRVAAATASLAASETARRQLEVAGAVKIERERLMREIHDGIGSSLITALAVAERQHQPANAIATLKRSIADLRIAVDSLEPIDGDVAMLLASLRYRMERELRDAGLTFVWNVTAAPPLEWLDAVGALHVLRILQEAIGNILMHARARLVQVECRLLVSNGHAGVLVAIRDDGCGFSPDASVNGRGLANMHARAEALQARLTVVSSLGHGSELALWLPVARLLPS